MESAETRCGDALRRELRSELMSALCGNHDADDVICDLGYVAILDELKKGAFQRGLTDALQHAVGGTIRNDLSLTQNDEFGADFLHNFEDVRAEENGFAAGA